MAERRRKLQPTGRYQQCSSLSPYLQMLKQCFSYTERLQARCKTTHKNPTPLENSIQNRRSHFDSSSFNHCACLRGGITDTFERSCACVSGTDSTSSHCTTRASSTHVYLLINTRTLALARLRINSSDIISSGPKISSSQRDERVSR